MALLQISEPGKSLAPHQRRIAVGIDFVVNVTIAVVLILLFMCFFIAVVFDLLLMFFVFYWCCF
jgi:hypothetical protein